MTDNRSGIGAPGTQCTCFTGTNVQIVTHEELRGSYTTCLYSGTRVRMRPTTSSKPRSMRYQRRGHNRSNKIESEHEHDVVECVVCVCVRKIPLALTATSLQRRIRYRLKMH
jgi:hypothetical protein